MTKILYIVGPGEDGNGDGPYALINEDGYYIAGHYCSHRGFAKGDLWDGRPKLQEKLAKRINGESIEFKNPDQKDLKKLQKANKAFATNEACDEYELRVFGCKLGDDQVPSVTATMAE